MITILSSDSRDRASLVALCETRGWPVTRHDSLRGFRLSLDGVAPTVVVTRRKLIDGYSDDVLVALREKSPAGAKVIVLTAAGSPSREEARQLSLGADCVLRDPIRPEVLLEYLAKFRSRPAGATRARAKPLKFVGATFDPLARTLHHAGRTAQLTPREAALARLLVSSPGEVVSYEELYEGVLGRRFRGDTSNMRVLLGKLAASTAGLGLPVREWLQVIPKTGYRYIPPDRTSTARSTTASAA